MLLRPAFPRWTAPLALLALVALPARAHYYETLLDADNNAATGGAVTVVQGAEAPHDELGVDYIVRAEAPLCEFPFAITHTQVLRWDGVSFVQVYSDGTDYPVGADNGNSGRELVEWQVPLTAFTVPALGNPAKGVFHASRNEGQDNDYTAPFLLFQATAIDVTVPTVGTWGLVVVALLLAAAAVGRLRRGAVVAAFVLMVLSGASVAMAATMDGEATDWQIVAPVLSDPTGDSSISDPAEDIHDAFAVVEPTMLVFRVDIGDFPIAACG